MHPAALAFAFSFTTVASAAQAQTANADGIGNHARQIDSVVDAVRGARKVPGVVVLIAKGDRPVFVRGYGYADVARRTPFTSTTRFNLASNAKQFVAVCILQLAERGALSLDDDVTKYVPELDTHGRRVSLRDLLRHTSGLSVVGTAEPGQLEREYPRAEIVSLWATRSHTQMPTFEPGTAFQYRDFNFQLLGLVLERVSGKTENDHVKAQLFAPTSMSTAGVCDAHPGDGRDAVGYLMGGANHDSLTIAPMWNPSWNMGAGGYCASAEDMLRWVRALHHGKLLTPESYARMISPDTLVSGQRLEFGYGIIRWTVDGSPMLWHSGGAPGFYSFVAYLPATDETFIVFANGDADIWAFATAILHVAHGTMPHDVAATAESLARFAGSYDGPSLSAVVRIDGDHLKARVNGTNSATFNFEPRLLNQGNGKFLVSWEPNTSFQFDTEGTSAGTAVLHHGGRDVTLRRRAP
jgi:CubicO group peptidase (beta-lactamase class C family)